MKSKIFLLFIVACAGATGWFAGHHLPERPSPSSPTVGRRIKFYQSSMHPWITSDKPGKCTVCGMDLVPVYEGDPGFAPGTDLVTLSSNSINVIHVQTEEVKRRPLERKIGRAHV